MIFNLISICLSFYLYQTLKNVRQHRWICTDKIDQFMVVVMLALFGMAVAIVVTMYTPIAKELY